MIAYVRPGWAGAGLTSPERPGIDNPVLAYIGLAALVVFLVGCVVAGVMAYTGRWRSWYPPKITQTCSPLSMPWAAGAFLLMLLAAGLDVVLDGLPMVLGFILVGCAVVLLLIGLVYVFPPRRLLPRWIRDDGW
ncbi:hypothetical protein Acsp03_48620 [Actinomadura sp. NBRC 104412]|uniref:hypothetical protein n=1 Tax=Actinomadura sp. NBRC 104412 TaxID=3032203 RepID=UPI0024A20233|nr:hypothetical protein [Actinomadura sp. NBRC 104412]GLZ07396.1 hypothetical protein Acsp03_48620 [Actinomadura sp. NBRC 104412]